MIDSRKKQWLWILKKIPSLLLGLALYAAGNVAALYADLGMNPWGVFHMGISNHTPLTFGQANQLIGLAILLTAYGMGIIPGLGSIANMIFIGAFIDIFEKLNIFKAPKTLFGQYIMLFFGILIIGWGTFLYLRVNLGAGPRDGLMEGLVRKFKKPVWLIRGVIETIALIIGYFLGGPVGIGTVITALTIGFSVSLAFKVGGYDSNSAKHMNCLEVFQVIKEKKTPEEISCQ